VACTASTVCAIARHCGLHCQHSVCFSTGNITTTTTLAGQPSSRTIRLSQFQNSRFIGIKDDGGGDDNRSYKTCKALVKLSPSAHKHPAFYRLNCPSCRPTSSVRALKEKSTSKNLGYHSEKTGYRV